jgi:hypothetical protein
MNDTNVFIKSAAFVADVVRERHGVIVKPG